MSEQQEPPIFVPVAFTEDQALHLIAAARTVFMSGTMAGQAKDGAMAPLAQAMVLLAEATDEAREKEARARDLRMRSLRGASQTGSVE